MTRLSLLGTGPSPSGDVSGATDTAALQAFLTGNPAGAAMVLSRAGTVPFWLNAPLQFRNGQHIVGFGPAKAGATMFKQAAGANLVAPGTPALNGRGLWVSGTVYIVGDAVLVAVQQEGQAFASGLQRGNFAGSTAYALNDVVFNPTVDNLCYVNIAAYTSSATTPDQDPTHWQQVATQLYRCTLGLTSATNPTSDGAHWTVVGSTGLFVPYEWANNQNFDGQPALIENIGMDGNRSANPYSTICGAVTQNFWTDLRKCLIQNVSGSGILQTDTTANGTSITNSSSENRIVENKIVGCNLHGIRSTNALTTTNQDGFCEDNILSAIAGSGILFDRISGWKVAGNHLYNIGMHGIFGNNAYASRILDNEIEDFGGADATGYFYQGISLTQLNGRGSWISRNFVGCVEKAANAVGNYQYIVATAGASQTDAQMNVMDNHLDGAGTAKGLALVYQINSGGILRVRSRDNRIDNVNGSFFQVGAKILENDANQREHAIFGATTAAFNGTNGNNAALVAGGNDFGGQITCGTPGAVAAGAMCGITFEQGFAVAPTITVTPANVATAGLGVPYLSSVGTGAFTINVPVAPAISQGAGTYAWNFAVRG